MPQKRLGDTPPPADALSSLVLTSLNAFRVGERCRCKSVSPYTMTAAEDTCAEDTRLLPHWLRARVRELSCQISRPPTLWARTGALASAPIALSTATHKIV